MFRMRTLMAPDIGISAPACVTTPLRRPANLRRTEPRHANLKGEQEKGRRRSRSVAHQEKWCHAALHASPGAYVPAHFGAYWLATGMSQLMKGGLSGAARPGGKPWH